MANFGFSIGDIVTVGSLAENVYKACSNASSEFREVAREVISLHAAVKELEEEAPNPDSIIRRAIEHKQKSYKLLYRTLGRHDGSQEKRYHSFQQRGLEDVRSKVILHTSAVNLFLGSLSAASLGRVERKLDEIVNELRNGQRDTSAIAVSDDEDDPVARQQWRALRKELVEDGFRKEDIDDHKAWIKAEMRKRITGGEMPEMNNEMDIDVNSTTSNVRRPPFSNNKFTERYDHESDKVIDMDFSQPSYQDMGVASSSIPDASHQALFSCRPMSDSGGLQSEKLEPSNNLSNSVKSYSTDPIPRNDYECKVVAVDRHDIPPLRRTPSILSITSIHSEVSEHDINGNLVKRTVTTTTTTYYSTSATDDSDRDNHASTNIPSYNTLPGLQRLLSNTVTTQPQSPMEQIASKPSTKKKHPCKYFNKSFSLSTHLQIHMRNHNSEKPYKCSVKGCDREFRAAGNLKLHQRRHQKEKQNSDADSESEL